MDVNQNAIKINQTLMNNGITKINNKANTSMINFDKVLSMFSLLGQSPELTDKETTPSFQKSLNEISDDSKSQGFDQEDWKKLDSILTFIIAGIQQSQFSSSQNELSEVSFPAADSPSFQNSLIGNQKDYDTYDWGKMETSLSEILTGLEQLQGLSNSSIQDMQNVKREPLSFPNMVKTNQMNIPSSTSEVSGMDQSSTKHVTGLIKELQQLVMQIQLQEKNSSLNLQSIVENNKWSPHFELNELVGGDDNQSQFSFANGIINKIQDTLDYIKQEFKTVDGTLINSKLTNNHFLPKLNVQSNDLFKSLGQESYQLNVPISPKLAKNYTENNLMEKIPNNLLKKETLSVDNSFTFSGHPVEKTDGTNQTNLLSDSAPISVSEFVPKVSEWIGRFMGISSGQLKSAETKFSLYPEHLGHIEIKITSQQGHISAQIVTDTPAAKEALDGQLQHLKQAIQQHGIVVQKLDIVQQPSVEFNSNNLSFSQGGPGSQNQSSYYLGREADKKQKEHSQQDTEMEGIPVSYGGIQNPISTIDFTA